MAYRFVHAADIHLDSPLSRLRSATRDLQTSSAMRPAACFRPDRRTLPEEQVDALLLAGDLYDGDQTSMKTARFLAGKIRQLDAGLSIRAFVIRGNHDALSRITKELTFP